MGTHFVSYSPDLVPQPSSPQRWEGDLKRRALAAVLQNDGGMMGLQDAAGDGQPDAGSTLLAAGGEERVEQSRCVSGRDAPAIVANRKGQSPSPL